MSRQEEDTLMEVYLKVKKKGIRKKFDKQLKKMSTQEKHKWKTPAEKWEYALLRVEGWNPNNN